MLTIIVGGFSSANTIEGAIQNDWATIRITIVRSSFLQEGICIAFFSFRKYLILKLSCGLKLMLNENYSS